MLARAIQGSNSIGGIVVDDDAAAAVDDEAPVSADEQTWADSAIRAMHFMMGETV